jgi:hypothetical protein
VSRRKYVKGVTASLSALGFCRRCGLHVTQIVDSKLNPHLHLCDEGNEKTWLDAFPYEVQDGLS